MRSRLNAPLSEAEQTLLENTYYQHRDAMYAAAFSCLRNEADAEDVVQEVFLKLARKHMPTVKRLSEEGTLLFYLLTTTRNAALDHLKKASVQKESPVDPDELPEALLADDSFVDQLNASLDVQALTKIIDGMEPMYRDVLIQHFLLDLSVREIAGAAHAPVITIKKRLQKAKQLLWKLCKEESDE